LHATVISFFAHLFSSFSSSSYQPLAIFFKIDLKLSHTLVGALTSSFYLGLTVASVLTGSLVDSLGPRKLIKLGMLTTGILIGSIFLAHFYWQMVVLLVLAGIGCSAMNPATTKLIFTDVPAQIRGTAMGVKQMGVMVGGIIASLILPLMAVFSSWRMAFATAGVSTALTGLLIHRVLASSPQEQGKHPANSLFAEIINHFKEVVTNRSMLILCVHGILRTGAQYCLTTYLALFAKQFLGYSLEFSVFLLAVAQAGGAAGRVGWGVISDWIFHGQRKMVLIIIGLVSFAFFFMLGNITGQTPRWLVFFVALMVGFAAIGYQGITLAFIGELAGTKTAGTAVGFSSTINFIGSIIMPPFFGYLVDCLGSYQWAWWMSGLSWGVATIILIFLVNENKNRELGKADIH